MGEAYERGLLLYQRRRYREAADEFRRGLAIAPTVARGHAMLGLSLLFAGDWDGGYAAIHEAVRVGPDEGFPFYAMACLTLRPRAAVVGGRLAKVSAAHPDAARLRTAAARGHARTAIALDPNRAEYLALLAAIEHDMGDWPAAIAAARRGLAVQPAHGRCGTVLAQALAAAGRRDEAEQVLCRVLAANPEFAPAHLASSWLSLERGNGPAAADHVRESLRLDPTQVPAHRARRLARWVRLPVVPALLRTARRQRTAAGIGTVALGAIVALSVAAAAALAPRLEAHGLRLGVLLVGLMAGAVALMRWEVRQQRPHPDRGGRRGR